MSQRLYLKTGRKCSVDLLSQLRGGNSALSPFPVGAFIEAMQPGAWQPRLLQIMRLTFLLGKNNVGKFVEFQTVTKVSLWNLC